MLYLEELPVFQARFHHRIAVQHREGGGGFQRPHKAFTRQRLLAELFCLLGTHYKTSGMGVVCEIKANRFMSFINSSGCIPLVLHKLSQVLGVDCAIHQ